MKTSVSEALILCFVMAVVIFFCRIFPFLFFRGSREANEGERGTEGGHASGFLAFVGKTAPPVAMTVLAFNSLPIKSSPRELIPAIAAAVITAIIYILKRNTLVSICGGTALYMLLIRVWV